MLATLLSIAAEGGGEAKEVVNPVIPEPAEMVWGAVAFFLLLILMNWVLLPPLRAAMRTRAEQIRGDEEAAERAGVEAEQIRRDYDATLAEARTEAARLIEDARSSAEERRSSIVRAAEDEVAALRQTAIAELAAERANALGQLQGDVATIAVSAAGKVVQRDLDVASNRAVVEAHLSSTDATA